METLGYEEGAICSRSGCKGAIQIRPVENCSCHISPPCGACTGPRLYCDACQWEEANEVIEEGERIIIDINSGFAFARGKPRPLDPTKIDYRISMHTNSSQICEGVYPEGTTRSEVEACVRGTFGGRFNYFENGRFKYIAYTD